MACPHGCCDTYREHLLSISISASALPTRRPEIADGHKRDSQLDRDRAAYKRLRAEGLQPPTLAGAAKLEAKAGSKAEVNAGQPMNRRQRAQYELVTGEKP